MLEPHRSTFRAFATTVVPEMKAFDDIAWSEVERTVEHAIAQRPARLQRQLALLLRAIESIPRMRYGRAFTALNDDERSAMIETLQHAPVKLVRRGVWGLRTLVLMGCYTRVQVMAEVGYRAHARGWDARRGQP